MQIEHTEVNGFQIDEFNIHKLEEGKKQGVCPLCSSDRKASNQKAKCASYDWQRGLGTCHNCDNSFQMHTYKRKGESEKVYIKPNVYKAEEPGMKVESWFKTRGISKSTLNDLKVSEGAEWMPQTGKSENVIKFNYFIGGKLINIKYRDGRKNFKLYKGAEKVFYNIDSILGHDYCVIVEGEMDVLALHEAGITNAISVPNGATLKSNNLDYLDSCIDYFDSMDNIIIATDTDDAGLALQAELVRRLGSEVCLTATFEDCKDANEYLVKHGKDKLIARITNAKPVPLENVTTFKDHEEEVIDFVNNGFKPGFQIGLNNFDEIFSTYTGQFITVTGIPSSGKSDFVDQMCVGYNANYGWKTAFASPENKPNFLHAHKLIRKTWGIMPQKSDIGSEKWKEVTSHCDDSYYHIDMESYSLESVLAKGAELVKRKGIKCLVIDPFNKVRAHTADRNDVSRYTMDYLMQIEAFVKKYAVLIILVAHPTKMYKNDKGVIETPTMYNVKGGSEFYDASYHGLVVHRDYIKKTVMVKVLKVKFQHLGENGAECHFTWNENSGRYIPHEDININSGSMPWE
jgi:twinkle protein